MWIIRLAGAACMVTAGALLGIHRSREYARRVRECEDMLHSLARMKREIDQRLTPMLELFEELAQQKNSCQSFFHMLSAALEQGEEHTLAALWTSSAEACLPSSSARDQFAALGRALGCYDAAAECAAIDSTCAVLEEERRDAIQAYERDGSLWRKLGVAGGVIAAVCLI